MTAPRPSLTDAQTSGVAFALLAVCLFTPVFAAGRFLDAAAAGLVLIWLRYLSGAATLVLVVLVERRPIASLRSAQPLRHALRALLGAAAGACAIEAAARMPVAEAAAVGLVDGLLVLVLARILLGERVSGKTWLGALACGVGAALAIAEGALATATFPWDGVLAALLGAAFMAGELLLLKTLARRDGALTVLLHVNVIATILLAAPALAVIVIQGLSVPLLAPLLALGPIALLAQAFNIAALRRADASTVGPVGYAWIVFAAAFGWLLFGETPAPLFWPGALLIVLGGVTLARSPAIR